MRNGKKKIEFYVDDDLYDYFEFKLTNIKLSKSAYLRMMIKQVAPVESPSNEYFQVVKDLHGIANNINQITAKANKLNWVDKEQYDSNYKELNKVILKIMDLNTKPVSIELLLDHHDKESKGENDYGI